MPGLLTERIQEGQKRKGLLDIWKDLITGFNNNPDNAAMFSDKTLYDKSDIYKSIKDAVTAPVRAYRGEIGQPWADESGQIHSGQEQALQEAANLAGMAQLGGMPGGARGPGSVGMTVYHGSPHKFDKFDMSKIGTGEGAQAYGHGLYMAGHPATAEVYASKLANGGAMPMPPVPHDFMVDRARYVRQGGGLFKQVGDSADLIPVTKGEYGSALTKAQDVYDAKSKAGNLYKADIPDEAVARMLDWDLPLSEQHPDVQTFARQALAPEISSASKVADGWGDLSAPYDAFSELTGRDLVSKLRPNINASVQNIIGGGGHEVSSALRKAGIPGIRYLDGGSRTAGNGTSNFVLFDDQLPRILERNGEATGLKPWQPGEANALLGLPPAAPMRPRNALGQEIPPTQYELAHLEAQRVAALPIDQGGLGLPEGNTAMERARAMGFDTDAYHGTNSDITAFDHELAGGQTGNPNSVLGTFTTQDPVEASRYAKDFGRQSGGNVIPLSVHTGNQYEMPYTEANDLAMGLFTAPGSTPAERAAASREIARARKSELVSQGYDGATVSAGHPYEEIVAFSPNNIRSRFAAFNPAKRDSADLLAGLYPYAMPAATAGLLSSMYPYEDR